VNNFAAECQRLTERRDLSAYNCVNAIRDVLNFFEAQDFEQSRQMLQDALDLHKDADRAITEFHKSQTQKKENSPCQRKRSQSIQRSLTRT